MTAGGGNKLPFGNFPRLLMAWVCTEAVRTQSRVLLLGSSLAGFMRTLGSTAAAAETQSSSRFCPWVLDVDGSGAAGGSMIRHAPETALRPVDPLPVPVIELSFRAVLVFPVGKPHLLASHPAAAPFSAVDLPPVAGTTDVEPHSATRASAKQLDPCHFAGHTPHDSIAACEPCRVGGDAGGIDLGLRGVGEWANGLGGSMSVELISVLVAVLDG